MRRFARHTATCLMAVTALGACRPDEVITTPDIPVAGVRFINAVPDSSGAFGMDFRFVDLVENNHQFRITYRNGPAGGGTPVAAQTQYKPARAGLARSWVVFLNDTLQSVASTRVFEGSTTFEEGKNYTYIAWGRGRAGTLKLSSWKDYEGDPGTKVAIRVINATESPIDVRHYVTGGTVPASPTFANVAGLTASDYILVDPASLRFNIRAAGGTTNLVATDITALPGAPAGTSPGGSKKDIPSQPGTTVAGSAVSIIVFPPSTPGTKAAQFSAAGAASVWDRRPPRGTETDF